MAEADLSKIINLIMENPTLIEQIKGLAAKSDEEKLTVAEENPPEVESKTDYTPPSAATYEEANTHPRSRRKNLLYAIKPYLSSERGKAIETMLSIADILDMIKTR